MITNRLLGTLGLAVALAGTTAAATASDASADVRVRIGGSAHVRIGGPRVHVRPYRPWRPWRPYRPVVVGGSVWVGGYYYDRPFAQPPPPPPPPAACDCAPSYYPLTPAPTTVYAAAAVEEPPLPRFGIGAFLGGVSVDGEHEGEDVGLVGQFRLGQSALLLEGEIAKNTLEDGSRVDRRMMIGLDLELGKHRRLAPYLAAGLGTTQVEVEGGWEDNQAVAELGVGLRYRLSDRITLFGDLRWGSRESIDGEDGDAPAPLPADGTTARTVMPDDDGESYSRMRLGGLVTF